MGEVEFVSFSSKILKQYKTEHNKKCLHKKDKIKSIIDIDIFDGSTSINVIQYQPKESLNVITNGSLVSIDKNNYIEKYNQFIDMSINDKYSLILTPEYSVPLETLEYLLKKKDCINRGSLYCVCCEGMRYSDFSDLSRELSDSKSIEYRSYAIDNSTNRSIVCVLFYIVKVGFELYNGQILEKTFITPQFKATPMKDDNYKYERSGLTQGRRIIYFGDKNSNAFFSLLCADAYNLEIINGIYKFFNGEMLIFNPQLNQGAENKIFCFIREYLYAYSDNRITLINLNWARGTKVSIEGESNGLLQNPLSGVYFNFEKRDLGKVLKVFPNNAYWGIDLGVNENMGFWFINPKEHVLSYNLPSFKNTYTPIFVGESASLSANTLYFYNKNTKSFVESGNVCKESIDAFFIENKEFSELNKCFDCDKHNCTKCELNKFSALLFDNNLLDEYDMIYEKSFIGISSGQYNSYSNEKVIICRKILDLLKNNQVPERFKKIDKNIKFIIEENNGKDYNVVFNDSEYKEIKCRVVYLKYKRKEDAERIYSKLIEKYGVENKDNIIVFYESFDGCKVIPEFNNKDILGDNDAIGNKIAGA